MNSVFDHTKYQVLHRFNRQLLKNENLHQIYEKNYDKIYNAVRRQVHTQVWIRVGVPIYQQLKEIYE